MVETTEAIRIQLQFEADQAQKKAKTMERQLNSLENRFDPLNRATKKYENGLKTLEKNLEAGNIDLARYEKNLESLNREFDTAKAKATGAGVAVANMNAPVSGLTGVMNRNRQVFQQAGYQVGDFAVQVQGGQSAITAFSQQGSQMLGVFGAYGAIAGAALAITAPLVGSLFNGADAASELENTTANLASATADYISAIESQNISLGELEEKYGKATIAALALSEAAREAASVRFGEAVGESIEQLINGSLGEGVGVVARFDTLDALEARLLELQELFANETDLKLAIDMDAEILQIQDLFFAITGLADELGISEAKAVSLTNALGDLQSADVGSQQADAAAALLDALTLAYGTYQEMTPEARALYDQTEAIGDSALQIAEQMEIARAEFSDAAVAAAAIGTNLYNSVAGADALIGRAQTLATNLWDAAAAMATARAEGIARGPDGAVEDVRNTLTPDGRDRSTIVFQRTYPATTTRNRPSSGGGSGGASGGSTAATSAAERAATQELNEMRREAARVIESLMTETEEYNAEMARLSELQAAGELTTGQLAAAQADLTETFRDSQFADARAEIDSFTDALFEGKEGIKDYVKTALEEFAKMQVSGMLQSFLGIGAGGSKKSGGGGILGGLFAGFFDKGGNIPSGQFGIAGENGPEIIRGPANVTSTRDTANMMGGGSTQNITIDARGAQEGVADQIVAAIQKATPSIQAGAQRNTLQYMSETQDGWGG